MLIPRTLVQRYVATYRLKNTVGLLRSIRSAKGSEQFIRFCRRCGLKITAPVTPLLFHGSQRVQKHLSPNRSMGTHELETAAYVYATDDPNYAIFLATLTLAPGGTASVSFKNGKIALSVNTGFVNGSSKLLPGYVHLVPHTSFKRCGTHEYRSDTAAPIIYSIRVSPEDLSEPIEIIS